MHDLEETKAATGIRSKRKLNPLHNKPPHIYGQPKAPNTNH